MSDATTKMSRLNLPGCRELPLLLKTRMFLTAEGDQMASTSQSKGAKKSEKVMTCYMSEQHL